MNKQSSTQPCPILEQLNDVYINYLGAALFIGYSTRWLSTRRKEKLPPTPVLIGNQYFYRKKDLQEFKK